MHQGAPLPLYATHVVPDWIDYNGHMNDAAYAVVFSRAVDALMDRIGLDAASRKATGQTLYTLQMMVHYFHEAPEGASLKVACHLIEHDAKRMRVWLEMRHGDGALLAASEQLLISIDKRENARAVPWRAETLAALDALARSQRNIARAPHVGKGISLTREG